MARAVAAGEAPEGRAALPARPRLDLLPFAVLALALALAALVAALLPEDVPGPQASARVFPARLVRHIAGPDGAEPSQLAWNQPSDVALAGGRRFVLDTGNNRILELDGSGNILRALDQRTDERLALRGAMAIAGDGERLYVANSGAAQVLVLTPDGAVVRAFAAGAEGDALPARPIGVAAAANGDILVSDAANQRVLRYDAQGRLLWAAGGGGRSGGEEGFNTPAGLAVDAAGNAYAVDIINGRVVKLAPDGSFVGQYGGLGESAGALARPKDVALDAAGNVYVSDGLLAAVQVFAPDGTYLGFIGLKEPPDRGSGALFKAPAGLAIDASSLYVVDRFASVFVFDLPAGR